LRCGCDIWAAAVEGKVLRLDDGPSFTGGTRPSPGAQTGLIRNPRSRRNRRSGARSGDSVGDILVAEPDTVEALTEVLRDFAKREVGLVIVDGGDGTVREVLTALPGAYGEFLPRLAVLASGTTNLIAADVGAGRSDPSTIQMLATISRAAGPVQRRSTLAVSWPDGSHRTVHGMFVGAAAFTRATEISVHLVRQGRIEESAGVAATLMSAIAQTFAGPARERWLKGDPMSVTLAGRPTETAPRFILLATTLHKLVLGIWPFWSDENASGPVRYLDVLAPPRRLVAALPAVMRGRSQAWMGPAGYRSGTAASLDLALSEPFVIDGEVFHPGPGGTVRLSAGPELEFLVP